MTSRAASESSVAAFWDSLYSKSSYSRAPEEAVLNDAIRFFGELRDKRLVEIGAGPGAAALHLATQAGSVIGIDLSKRAIDDLNAYCAANGVKNVRGVCASAFAIADMEPADFVYGSMILHHLEPFEDFARVLNKAIRPGGKAFFYENSAVSSLLVWFRQHVVGHLWIPKYGDDDEFPLTPAEIAVLRRYFTVRVEYPELLFFRLASQYLFRGHLMRPMAALDSFFYRRGWLLRYSYRQYVLLSK